MKFNNITGYNLLLLCAFAVPYFVSGASLTPAKKKASNKVISVCDKVLMWLSAALMLVPLLVNEFQITTNGESYVYLAMLTLVPIVYIVLATSKKASKNKVLSWVIALLPAVVFVTVGAFLRHWLLVGVAAAYLVVHVLYTCGCGAKKAKKK